MQCRLAKLFNGNYLWDFTMNNINHQMAQRRFGRFNTLGVKTLCIREVKRFLNVYTQTLVAPVATSGLFLLVFSLAFAARRGNVGDIPYTAFLAPGIVMMAVIQQAFANTSSSLILAKVQGNIVDTLMPPLSPIELTVGIASGGTVRGVSGDAAGVYRFVSFCWCRRDPFGLGDILYGCGSYFACALGDGIGYLGRKIRSYISGDKFYCCATIVFVWYVLFDLCVA